KPGADCQKGLDERQPSSFSNHHLTDRLRGLSVGHPIGVDDHVIEQGIVYILVEVFLQITAPTQVFPAHELSSFLFLQFVKLPHAFQPLFESPDQPHMKHVIEMACDDATASSDDDYPAQFHQTENGLCGFSDERPRLWMETEELIHRIGDLRNS